MRTCLLTLLGALPFVSLGSELPELVIPAGVGVNIHFTSGHEADLDLIAAAGFKFIRMDFGWAGIERQKDRYNWSEYDRLTAELEKRGLRAIYILDYSNPLYEEDATTRDPITGKEQRATASPQHPESVAAFARWAGMAAKHFQGRHVVWEIWNEPNISFWKPKPDAVQYSTLAQGVCQAVRAADPGATIIGPATSEFPWPFLETCFQMGLLDELDGVSVHPYRNPRKPPETAAADYQKLRGLIDRLASTPAKKTLPIISGEWGYSSNTKGVSIEVQSAFIARQHLFNLLQGVPLSIWYDWKNDGSDPAENEHNFGTVTPELKPKPAYVAIQTMTRQLSGYRVARRLELENAKDYVLLLENGAGNQKLAAWTLGESHAATVQVKAAAGSAVTAVRGNGEEVAANLDRETLHLDLAMEPKYFTLKNVSVMK